MNSKGSQTAENIRVTVSVMWRH